MEWAEALHGPARTAEGDVGADYFLDPGRSRTAAMSSSLIRPPTDGVYVTEAGQHRGSSESSEGVLSVESAHLCHPGGI